MYAPLAPVAAPRPARSLALCNLLPVAFFSFSLFFVSEKRTQGQTQPTAPVIRGTLQIFRGPATTPVPVLKEGQQYMILPQQTGGTDAQDFDLYIGTAYGNRRTIQRFLTGQGAPGNTSNQGAILDMYLDKATGLLYQKTSAGWGTGISLSPTFGIGTVSTLPATSAASVTITGAGLSKLLNFGLPQGAQGLQGIQGLTGDIGPTPNLTATAAPLFTSATPTVTRAGTNLNPVFNFSFAAAPYTFMASVPAIAAIEINTDKQIVLTFPAAFPTTNYVYSVQFVSTSGGLINTLSWSQGAKTSTSLTLNVRSTAAVLGGSAQAWVMVAHKNAP